MTELRRIVDFRAQEPELKRQLNTLEQNVDDALRALTTDQIVITRAYTGRVTISNTDTSAVITFVAALPDADYDVRVFPRTVTGSPLVDALVTTLSSITTTGFTLLAGAAPGAGASVTYYWEVAD